MEPIWYTIRIVVTVVMMAIGGLLLWAAYAVSDNVNGAAAAWMVLVGLALPSGFFALFTLIGWQRSAASGATPNALIAWCNDPRRYPLLWLGFVGILFGAAYQIPNEIHRGEAEHAAKEAFARSVRENLGNACYAHAREVIGGGASPDVALNVRVPHFCSCLDLEVEKTYTPQQFADVPKERWWQGGDEKIDRIIHKCRLYDSSVVRVVRLIRKDGGNPDSTPMRARILDYAACADLEVRDLYRPAELLQVSADTGWQDADQRFQQIVVKCTKYAGW